MAVVAEFTVPAAAFPLGVVFSRFDDVTVELDRVVPLEEGVVPYLWVHGPAVERIEQAFAEYLPEHEMDVLDSVGGQHLLRVAWAESEDGLLHAFLTSDVSLLSGTGTATEWRFEVRGSRDDVAAFETACRAAGISLRLALLHAAVPVEPERSGLTEKQYEAVLLAFQHGYFDTPRKAALDEIAAELDISRQALASRLRRGLRHIVGSALTDWTP